MCWKAQNSKQNTVMFPQCPRDIGDILTWVNISDWFVMVCTPRDKQEWFLDLRGPLIVSIYNQTFVKQIVGNMSQCPTSTDFSSRFEPFNLLQTQTPWLNCFVQIWLDPDIEDRVWQMISWHFTWLCWWCWDTGSLTLTHTGARLGNAWEIFMKF